MAISELVRLVTPPVQPIQAEDEEAIRAVERFLGLRLPADYVDLARHYGTGSFGDSSFYFWIDDPMRSRSTEILEQEIACWRQLRSAFPKEFAFDLYPAQPGYLPCGADVDGGIIGLLMEGSSDSWPVVAKSRDGHQMEMYRMPLTSFLAKALRQEIRPEVWRQDFPEDVTRVTFVPGEQYHQSVAYRR
jgi:hypothetical protein